MSETNAGNNSDWIRLNVGGKIFQTTKDTLSRHPESFLACLANGDLPSDKDDTGAILVDRSYEHFDTILNFFRSGVMNFDRSEKAMKDLLCEADFYNIQPLVDEILKGAEDIQIEDEYFNNYILMSEQREDYEVLQALRQKVEIKTVNENGFYKHYLTSVNVNVTVWMNIELTLRSFGFVQESNDNLYKEKQGCWKFVRTICE